MNARKLVPLGLVALAGTLSAVSPVTAQQPQQQPQQQEEDATLQRVGTLRVGGPTHEDIVEQIRASGMRRSEARTRLSSMGYDPTLADRYFDAAEGRRELEPGTPRPVVVEAFRRLGFALAEEAPADSIDHDVLDEDDEEESRIFGKSLFARATAQFDPVTTGPVPRDYQIAPGDEVWLILTGDVEDTYPLEVTREGFLIVPQVGQIPVAGLTLEQLEDRLYTYLGRAFSGVRRGPDATTRFQVSLGQLRPNQVFVVGEVEEPSGYQVSPLARAFNALYQAGGPNEIGSFRDIIVRRDGEIVARVDLYPYLLGGDASSDIRLQQGDMVFVPTAGTRVTMEGAVRRPGIYELRPDEDLRDAIGFAGGFEAQAFVRRVQIDRILPPDQRTPGRDRALIDVDVTRVLTGEAAPVQLRDGDVVTVFAVDEERRNRVTITGGVRRPGDYEWAAGMTLGDLVDDAQGLREGAYTERALIYRLQDDNTRRMLRTPLTAGDARELALADRDSVVVLREDSLRLPREVSILGYVKEPGSYPLAEGMSVRDLILAAGGFAEGANTVSAEVARSIDPNGRTSTTAEVVRVPLTAEAGDGAALDGVPRWEAEAAEFELLRGDRVYVRRAPGYEPPRAVQLTGEVMMPGDYELGDRQTRVAEVVRRAGGLTPEAYAAGFTIIRDERPVPVNLAAALQDPNSSSNILLEEGDSLHVPGFDGTVNVVGAVVFEAKVLYEPGRSVRDYINRAGGFAEHADRDAVVITYPNGERAVEDNLLMFSRRPRVQPGSTILVPQVPPGERQGVNWDQVLGRISATLGTLATLFVLIDRAGR